MKKENEGYFVIKSKDYTEFYISDGFYMHTINIDEAKPFETRTKAYKYMRENNLDKDYVIEEVKS